MNFWSWIRAIVEGTGEDLNRAAAMSGGIDGMCAPTPKNQSNIWPAMSKNPHDINRSYHPHGMLPKRRPPDVISVADRSKDRPSDCPECHHHGGLSNEGCKHPENHEHDFQVNKKPVMNFRFGNFLVTIFRFNEKPVR